MPHRRERVQEFGQRRAHWIVQRRDPIAAEVDKSTDQPGQWHLSGLLNAGGAKCPLTTAIACIKQQLDDHGRHRTEVDETKQSREQAAERRAGVETPKRLRQVQAIRESNTAAQESEMDTVRLMTW